jgi:hypothetical protein
MLFRLLVLANSGWETATCRSGIEKEGNNLEREQWHWHWRARPKGSRCKNQMTRCAWHHRTFWQISADAREVQTLFQPIREPEKVFTQKLLTKTRVYCKKLKLGSLRPVPNSSRNFPSGHSLCLLNIKLHTCCPGKPAGPFRLKLGAHSLPE